MVDHIIYTADTPERSTTDLSGPHVLHFLHSMAHEIGLSRRAIFRLSYSTSIANTGWTGFAFDQNGQIAFHHWDSANPCLLQADFLSMKPINKNDIEARIIEFWKPTKSLLMCIPRTEINVEKSSHVANSFDAVTWADRSGLGPDQHSHQVIEMLADDEPSEAHLCEVLRAVIKEIGMKLMTDVESYQVTKNNQTQAGCIAGITTSHASIHSQFLAGQSKVLIDIFSCKSFDSRSALEVLKSKFKNSRVVSSTLHCRFPKKKVPSLCSP